MPKKKTLASTADKLDAILHHLERLDKRDRLRTWGGFVRSILGLIPTAILLLGAWYLYAHGDDLIVRLMKEATKQAAVLTGQGAGALTNQLEGSGLLEQLQQFLR
jgi:hypothetical protein